MTRTQVIALLAEKSGLTKKQIKELLELIGDTIVKNEKIALPFGTFRRKKKPARPARKGVNPFTGEPMNIKAKPATSVLKFSANKETKEAVAKKK